MNGGKYYLIFGEYIFLEVVNRFFDDKNIYEI